MSAAGGLNGTQERLACHLHARATRAQEDLEVEAWWATTHDRRAFYRLCSRVAIRFLREAGKVGALPEDEEGRAPDGARPEAEPKATP